MATLLDINPTKYLGMEAQIADMRVLSAVGLGVALDEIHLRIKRLDEQLSATVERAKREELLVRMKELHSMMTWCAMQMKECGNG